MQALLRKMREERANGDRGFTMIELLVVVVIIGVLVAIAIPLYLNYRKGAQNKSAQSDVRSAISAIEQWYTDNANAYPGTAGAQIDSAGSPPVLPLGGTPAVNLAISDGNALSYKNNTTSYMLCALSAAGNYYGYNSAKGGSVSKVTATSMTTCFAAL